MITKTKPLTAIETLKKELDWVLCEQWLHVNDDGIVYPSSRYKYQQLVVKAKLIKESIDYLQKLKEQRA